MKKLFKSLNVGSSKLNKPASCYKALSGTKNINGKPGGSIVEGSYSVYEINPWP